ncbi:hypothetical protein SAMN05421763_106147 [[Luteovulum] sphaeroides subsp. megalophilum]|nr:hypothetical protein SAMN05421763_106147 [[Luteovulum] sphaeroides subsp. megalophilum]
MRPPRAVAATVTPEATGPAGAGKAAPALRNMMSPLDSPDGPRRRAGTDPCPVTGRFFHPIAAETP